MSKFKVGDWITIEGTLPDDKFKLTKEEVDGGEILLAHFSFPEETWKHWKPRAGEWCWFWDNNFNFPECRQPMLFQFSHIANNGQYFNLSICSDNSHPYENCEPFIGTLPSFIKNK